MRIISGKFKGSRLFLPLDKETRPLKDFTKEAIFNMLHHSTKFLLKIKNANILDLFSGTGSFGLECLSREANKVTFVENNENALRILIKNINKLKVEKKTKVLNFSVFNYLLNIKDFDHKIDFIFLDPPYKEQNIFELISNIHKSNILKNNGIIILHRNRKSENKYPKKFKILDVKNYGISKITFGALVS